jgi:hypothetical protein
VKDQIITIARSAFKQISDNSPTILTALGATGVVGTAVLAARGHRDARAAIMRQKHVLTGMDDGEWTYQEVLQALEQIEIPPADVFKLTWSHYLPAAVTGAASIACIIGANSIHTRRQAILMSAYTLSERALNEYQAKVQEVIGEKKAEAIKDEVAKDRVLATPSDAYVPPYQGKGQLCQDSQSGRYFWATPEQIDRAENEVNQMILNDGHASLNDFYRRIPDEELGPIAAGEELGWTNGTLIGLRKTAVLTPEDKTVLFIEYTTDPIRNYWRAHPYER